MLLFLGCAFVALSLPTITTAQTAKAPRPTRPPIPKTYAVKLRYQINAARDQHVLQFDAMIRNLKGLGFEFAPPLSELPNTIREDRAIDTLTGYIPGKKALNLLRVPRIVSVRLRPSDFDLPKDPRERVLVELDVASGFSPKQQLEFLDQLRALLDIFRFNESVGYDHRGITGQPFTRLRGTIPVSFLDTVLKDVRRQPTNWFSPVIPYETLPALIQSTNPVPLLKVLPDKTPPQPLPFLQPRGAIPEAPAGVAAYNKIGDRLWKTITTDWPARLRDSEPLRIEIILTVPPTGKGWRKALEEATPRLVIEGRIGNIVTATFGEIIMDKGKLVAPQLSSAPNGIKALSLLESVSTIRLPEHPANGVTATIRYPAQNSKALEKSGLVAFHKKGHRGKGIRLAILDTDFRNHKKLIADGKLPKSTILVDLTKERNRNVEPEPYPGRPDEIGHGTQCAFAASLAAPEAEIVLVRIADDDPTMLKTFFEYASGRILMSEYLSRQSSTFEEEANALNLRAQALKIERRLVLNTFKDEEELKKRYYYLKNIRPWVFTPREWYFHRQKVYDRDEAIYKKKVASFYKQLADVKKLRGLDIISSSLVWPDGYALSRRSALTNFIDTQVRRVILPECLRNFNSHIPKLSRSAQGEMAQQDIRPLWFQSVGNNAGQAWTGRFLDFDDNGVLEFRPTDAAPKKRAPPLPAGSWTRELNFVQWKPFAKKARPELPGDKTRYRVSLQWTEPHIPEYFFRPGEKDFYRFPLAGLRMVVLRQRDPSGKTLPADDFEVVARSDASPTPFDFYASSQSWVQRLNYIPASATYSLQAEWVADQPGRYAIRIERQLPTKWLVEVGPKPNSLQYNKITSLLPTGLLPVIIKNVPGHGPKVVTPTLTKLEPKWELNMRLLVRAIDGPHAKEGRPVWKEFSTPEGTIGLPGDGRGLIPVGALNLDGKRQPYSSPGPPAGMDLLKSPRVFGFDALGIGDEGNGPAFGSGVATPFVAGMAASILSSGQSKQELYRKLQGRK